MGPTFAFPHLACWERSADVGDHRPGYGDDCPASPTRGDANRCGPRDGCTLFAFAPPRMFTAEPRAARGAPLWQPLFTDPLCRFCEGAESRTHRRLCPGLC